MIYILLLHTKEEPDGELVQIFQDKSAVDRFLNHQKNLWDQLSILVIDYELSPTSGEGVVANVEVYIPQEFKEVIGDFDE